MSELNSQKDNQNKIRLNKFPHPLEIKQQINWKKLIIKIL